MGNCPAINQTFFSLIYLVEEFSLKEMRTWGRSKISSYCFSFAVNQVYSFGLNPGAREEHLMFIASTKIPERKGNIYPFNLYGQVPDYWSHVFSLIYPTQWMSAPSRK